jgi:hypothetical protein
LGTIAIFSTLASCSWITTWKSIKGLTVKNDPKTTLFGRKTEVPCEKNDIVRSCFCAFAWQFAAQADDCQPLARIGAITKKLAEKPTIGFLFFGRCDTIIA